MCSGQAMVESLLIVVLLTSLLFGTLSVCVMVINDMLSYEAAFSIARVAVVSPGNKSELDKRSKLAAALLLAPHTSQTSYIPYEIRTDYNDSENYDYTSRGKVIRHNTELRYLSKVLFSQLASPFERSVVNSPAKNMKMREASISMIKSPDEEYYNRAYNGAPNF